MRNLGRWAVIGLVGISLFGCAENGMRNEQMGAITGGILGGVLGSNVGSGKGRTAGIIAGTLIGGYAGSNVGKSMDDVNRMKMAQALESTRTHHTRSWVDPDTQREYSVTPVSTFRRSGRVCRNYTTSILIDGRLQTAEGVACRDAKGQWVIQSQKDA